MQSATDLPESRDDYGFILCVRLRDKVRTVASVKIRRSNIPGLNRMKVSTLSMNTDSDPMSDESSSTTFYTGG